MRAKRVGTSFRDAELCKFQLASERHGFAGNAFHQASALEDRSEGIAAKGIKSLVPTPGSSRKPRIGRLQCIHREVTDCVDAVRRCWGPASVQCRPSKHARHSRFDKVCALLSIPMRDTLAIRPEESRGNDWFLPCVPKNRVSLRCPKTRQKTELLWTRLLE